MGRKIDPEQRERIDKKNRALLERDLLCKQVVFASRPYEAHVQYSNFCNMSCIMCWNGNNPPLKKMSPEVLEKVGEQIAPSLSAITPYGGSEPLIVSWDDTRRMAEDYSIQLCLTTNVQFLDEEKFEELKDITETLFLSIDSHSREIFAKIRPGSRPERVFANLAAAARLAAEQGIECLANVVFMTENAALLPETVEYLASVGVPTVAVLQLIDVNGESDYSDPLIHFSSEYVELIKERCLSAAKEKRIRLKWLEREIYDFREKKVDPTPRKIATDRFERIMKYYLPGYCRNAYNRLRIESDGVITPCCYATDGDLVLGALEDQTFDEIWNGRNARDLRRAHLTWDFPSLCKSCRFTDRLPPESHLPFVDSFLESVDHSRESLECSIELMSPPHMSRHIEAPTIQIKDPADDVSRYVLVMSLGGGMPLEGGSDAPEVSEPEWTAAADGTLELAVPEEIWERLRTNLGYWWAIFDMGDGVNEQALRCSEIRCLVRHEGIARVAGSTLRYPDQGYLPVVDLGGAKQEGWVERGVLPVRPRIGERTQILPTRGRHRKAKSATSRAERLHS